MNGDLDVFADPELASPNAVKHPDHVRDVAAALAWLRTNTEGYDIPRTLRDNPDLHPLYENAFGTNAADWRIASPITYLAPGRGIPALQLARHGTTTQLTQLDDFATSLRNVGVSTRVIDARLYEHNEVNSMIGAAGDVVMTPPLMTWLREVCFPGG